jgi:hypothetical protein
MPTFLARLGRGTPCDVRRIGERRWRSHVCSTATVLENRVLYCHSLHWVYRHDGWEIRVAPVFLERRSDEPNPTFHVGITGTRAGLTTIQAAALREHLRAWMLHALAIPTFHHGGCVGADRAAHNLVREVYGRMSRIVVHPASDQPDSLTDWTDADELWEPFPSLLRNRHIVDATELLLACPRGNREEQRSGTWATIRLARKLRRGVAMFWPDGSTAEKV